MPKMDSVRRIRAEDYPEETRQTISLLAPILNSFMEQVVNIFDGNVDFENLDQNILQVDVTTVNGIPTQQTKAKFDVNSRVVGTICIRSQDLSNTGQVPVSTPHLTYTTTNDLLNVNHISGLQDNVPYRLTFLLIAN